MTVLVQNIKLTLSLTEKRDYDAEAIAEAKKRLRSLSLSGSAFSVAKRSVDARRKNAVAYLYSVAAELEGAVAAEKLATIGALPLEAAAYEVFLGEETLSARPYIIGFGPAGMFAALALAEKGYRPIVLERGDGIDHRDEAVKRFRENGILDPESNIQFGAGGAGTFSDGKLVTRKNDPLSAYVLERLVEFGAPREILTNARPHIGTDILKRVVTAIEDKILSLGGEIRYRHRVIGLQEASSGVLVLTDHGKEAAGAVILAIGHSARDTYEHLYKTNHALAAKAFSVGLRIEHKTAAIDTALYGDFAAMLPHAEYNLSYREGERGVYTFCMCPGGEVVAAASEPYSVVTNGMSGSLRDLDNANAALCVSVLPEDYGKTPMGAIAFQRRMEQAAFRLAKEAGGDDYAAPFMTLGDFLSGKSGSHYTEVKPSYRDGKVVPCDLTTLFSNGAITLMRKGLSRFGKTIKGYDAPFATLTGVETRTSAPLRILRNEIGESVTMPYLYPCGEGAGYAGGITSAALDGLKIAKHLMARFKPLPL